MEVGFRSVEKFVFESMRVREVKCVAAQPLYFALKLDLGDESLLRTLDYSRSRARTVLTRINSECLEWTEIKLVPLLRTNQVGTLGTHPCGERDEPSLHCIQGVGGTAIWSNGENTAKRIGGVQESRDVWLAELEPPLQ
jgi:hypothetical protein